MAMRANRVSNIALVARAPAGDQSPFRRLFPATIEQSSYAVPMRKAAMILSLIGISAAVWFAIGAALWGFLA